MRVYSTSGQGFRGLSLDNLSFLRTTWVGTRPQKFSRYKTTSGTQVKISSCLITGYLKTAAMTSRLSSDHNASSEIRRFWGSARGHSLGRVSTAEKVVVPNFPFLG